MDDRRLRADNARLVRRVAALEALIPRRVTVDLTNIAVGPTTIPITWSPPIPGGYGVSITVIAGAVNLPLLNPGVQSGSSTPSGCNILLYSTAVAPISAAGLNIAIMPTSS